MLSVRVTDTRANAAAVAVTGALDLGTGEVLLTKLSDLVDRGYVHLTVDAAAVTFCDSAGLGALLRARSRAMGLAGGLTVVEASPQLRRALRIAGLERMFSDNASPEPSR